MNNSSETDKPDKQEKQDKQDKQESPQEYLKFVNILTMVWTLFSMVYLSAVTFFVVPDGNNRNVDLILGFLIGTAISSLLSFHFGSSRSSVQKEKFIEGLKQRQEDHKLNQDKKESKE